MSASDTEPESVASTELDPVSEEGAAVAEAGAEHAPEEGAAVAEAGAEHAAEVGAAVAEAGAELWEEDEALRLWFNGETEEEAEARRRMQADREVEMALDRIREEQRAEDRAKREAEAEREEMRRKTERDREEREAERERQASMGLGEVWAREQRLVEDAGLAHHVVFRGDGVDEDGDVLGHVAAAVAGAEKGFYIGGCQSTVFRWNGGTTSRGRMTGHKDRWLGRRDKPGDMEYLAATVFEVEMVVVAVRQGEAGGKLEEQLISHFAGRAKCRNAAQDSRGLSRSAAANFIYVVRW